MKKTSFFLVLLALTVTINAQVSGIAYPVDTTLSTATSLTMPGKRTAPAGTAFHVKGVYRILGSGSQFIGTDTLNQSASGSSFLKVFTGLQAQTSYELGLVFYTNTYTDSFKTATWTGTTLPSPQQATATIIKTVPGIPQSMVIYSYSAIGASWRFFGQAAAFPFSSLTDTVILTGTGTDTLYVPTSANQIVPKGVIAFEPLLNGSGVTGISGNYWNVFTVPGYTVPTITSTTVSNITQDSFQVKSYIAVGNGGPVTVRTKLYNATGNTLVYTWPNQVITTDGYVVNSRNGLSTNTSYMIKVSAGNTSGTDDDSIVATTLQVSAPKATVTATATTLTSYSVTVKVEANGIWSNSRINRVYITDQDGTDSVIVSVTDTASMTFLRLNKVSNTSYTVSIVAKNVAGLTVSTGNFNVVTMSPRIPNMPQLGSALVSNEPSSVLLKSVSYSVASNDTMTILVGVRQDGTSYVDTVIGVGNLRGSGTIDILVSNLMGGTKYWFQVFGKSMDNTVRGNGQEKYSITVAPANPDVKDVIITQLAVSSVSGYSTFNGEGTPAQGKIELYQSGIYQTGTAVTSGGTGEFSQNFYFSSLGANAYFELRAIAAEVGGNNAVAVSKFFSTSPNGVEEIESEIYLETVPMFAWDLNGKLLGYGLRSELQKQDFGFGTPTLIIIGPQDKSLRNRYHGKKFIVS